MDQVEALAVAQAMGRTFESAKKKTREHLLCPIADCLEQIKRAEERTPTARRCRFDRKDFLVSVCDRSSMPGRSLDPCCNTDRSPTGLQNGCWILLQPVRGTLRRSPRSLA